jgi:hypothetical protein
MKKHGVLGRRLIGLKTELDLDAGLAEAVTATGGSGVGILQRRDHSPNPRADNGVRARRLFTLMGTGLESDDHRRPSSPVSCPSQRHAFSVPVTKFRMPSFPHQFTIPQNHGTHERVRLNSPPASPSEVEGSSHGLLLVHER